MTAPDWVPGGQGFEAIKQIRVTVPMVPGRRAPP